MEVKIFPHILINTGFKTSAYFVSSLVGTQLHLKVVLMYVPLTPKQGVCSQGGNLWSALHPARTVCLLTTHTACF